jgi:hypothetical protein
VGRSAQGFLTTQVEQRGDYEHVCYIDVETETETEPGGSSSIIASMTFATSASNTIRGKVYAPLLG